MDDCLCLNRDEGKPLEVPPSESAVFLHVYDLDSVTAKINVVTRHATQSGIFHVGVQVYGDEWSFGQHDEDTTGITRNEPKGHYFHVYRESVYMGDTDLSRAEVWLLLERLKPEWPGNLYHLFQRNCITFADVLCHELGVRRVPQWVWRLPRHGAGLLESIKSGMNTLNELDDTVGFSDGVARVQVGWESGKRIFHRVSNLPEAGAGAGGSTSPDDDPARQNSEDELWLRAGAASDPRTRTELGGEQLDSDHMGRQGASGRANQDLRSGLGGLLLPKPLFGPDEGSGGPSRRSSRPHGSGDKAALENNATPARNSGAALLERMSRSSDAIPLMPVSSRTPAARR